MHLRARAFLSGVFTVALQSNVITGVNPMSSTKAGGMSKGRKAGDLTARELKIRVSNRHAYDHAGVERNKSVNGVDIPVPGCLYPVRN